MRILDCTKATSALSLAFGLAGLIATAGQGNQGYYLLLAPLNVGNHTLHFKGSLPVELAPYWTPSSVDITDHASVKR